MADFSTNGAMPASSERLPGMKGPFAMAVRSWGADGWRWKPRIGLDVAGAAGLSLLAYTTVFTLTEGIGVVASLVAALNNTLPLLLLGSLVMRLQSYAPSRAPWAAAWHVVFASGFVVLWMSLIVLAHASTTWLASGLWSPRWFSGPGLTWQLMQGYCIYALVAIWASYRNQLELNEVRTNPPGSPAARGGLVLLRTDAGLVPVPLETIVAAEAAGDYLILHRQGGKVMVKLTLAELETRLDPGSFARVHRSWLVRLDAVSVFESVGQGRWRALLVNGVEAPVSKAGAQRLREITL